MSSHNPRVLLIEDNPGDADLVRLRLVESNSGAEVSCVDRLSTGLESLADQPPPSLVLLDLNLPDSHGAETFRRVLNKAPGVPVVILSGQGDEELAAKAVHQGVQDYLVKGDFDSRQLSRAMRYAIERQALLRSLDMSRQQQLQFKDEFLSHVSHELRTPLTCIYQFVTLLLDGLAGDLAPEQRDHLQTVLRSANQLRRMIGDLLEATRAESGKISIEPRCVVLAEVVQQAVAMLRTTAQEKRIGLEAALDSRIPLVYADPDRVLQVLVNLIDNAIKFTPTDGSVMVKACLVDADPESVYVSVTDTGRGIDPQTKALVFERLYQDPNAIDDSRKGLGLGLYISKELIRLHGGRIWVDSQLGHGSTFSFSLPLYSLPKILFPVITEEGRLRDSLCLIAVELAALRPNLPVSWKEARQKCRDTLRLCILPDRDILLPALGNTRQGESFLIVASTDGSGAKLMQQRIQEQLDACPELKASCASQISVTALELPMPEPGEPLQNLVQKVADSIAERVIATLRPARDLDQNERTMPVEVEPETKKGELDEQTENPDRGR